MNLNVETINDVSVVTIPSSFLNASNHEDFMTAITPVLELGTAVLLDLSQLESIDSSGLGVFAFCLRIMQKTSGVLKLCSPTAGVKIAFDMVHINRIVEVYETRDQALQTLGD